MMKTVWACMCCISGICLGSLLAYPTRGTSASEDLQDLHQEHKDGNIQVNDAGDSSRDTLHKTSRLNKLLDSYMNMLRAELTETTVNKLPDIIDNNEISNLADFENILALKDDSKNVDKLSDNVHNDAALALNYDLSELDSLPSKRQQGWYTPYGKRKAANQISTEDIESRPIKPALGSNDNDGYHESKSHNFLSKQFGIQGNSQMSNNAPESLLAGIVDGLRSDTQGSSEDNQNKDVKLQLENWKPDNKFRNNKRDNHQGWYTQYGKRNDGGLYLYLL